MPGCGSRERVRFLVGIRIHCSEETEGMFRLQSSMKIQSAKCEKHCGSVAESIASKRHFCAKRPGFGKRSSSITHNAAHHH